MKTIFVAGASGYTGQGVIRAALKENFKVIAHVRPDTDRHKSYCETLVELGAHVDRSTWEPAAMASSLAHWQPHIIFSLLGTTRARRRALQQKGHSYQYETYAHVDEGLTRLLYEAASQVLAQASTRFIYLSAMGVSRRAPGSYLQARWRVEQLLRTGELAYTIVRPGFISGVDRPEMRYLERCAVSVSDVLLNVLARLGMQRFAARYLSFDAKQLGTALIGIAMDEKVNDSILFAEDIRGYASPPTHN